MHEKCIKNIFKSFNKQIFIYLLPISSAYISIGPAL